MFAALLSPPRLTYSFSEAGRSADMPKQARIEVGGSSGKRKRTADALAVTIEAADMRANAAISAASSGSVAPNHAKEFSQGQTGHARRKTRARVGSFVCVNRLEQLDPESVAVYEKTVGSTERGELLERNALRYALMKSTGLEPVKFNKEFFAKGKEGGSYSSNKTVKNVLLNKTRRALRNIFGFDLMPKGQYVKDAHDAVEWRDDKKDKFHYIVNALAKPPRGGPDTSEQGDLLSERTDRFYSSLHGACDGTCVDMAIVMVTLSYVWTAQGHKIPRAELLNRLNGFFPDLDLRDDGHGRQPRSSRHSVAGNVLKFITKDMVTLDYLVTESGNEVFFKLGPRAHTEIGLQSIIHFTAVAAQLSGVEEESWKKWLSEKEEEGSSSSSAEDDEDGESGDESSSSEEGEDD